MAKKTTLSFTRKCVLISQSNSKSLPILNNAVRLFQCNDLAANLLLEQAAKSVWGEQRPRGWGNSQ